MDLSQNGDFSVNLSIPYWVLPNGNRVDFSGLIEVLQGRWHDISPRFPKVDEITVIGIDLTRRYGA